MLIAKGVPSPTAGLAGGLALVGAMLGSPLVPLFAFAKHRTWITILICAILAPIFFIGILYVPVSG